MNLAQALGAAAAALFVGLYPQTCGWGVSAASAQVAAQGEALTREAIRAAARELAEIMEASYVFPDQADRYAAHLRQRAAAGAYDSMTDPAVLAATLQAELRAVHQDAHLRISPVGTTETAGRRIVRGGGPSGEFAQAQWLSEGVAYLRINSLPGGEDVGARMSAILDPYENADTLIIDVRACPGGTLPAMDALFARLYAEPTFVMTMDTRTGANPQMERDFEGTPTLRRAANAPRGITRFEHWAQPASPVSSLSDARVFVLTGRTGSACEHLSQALRETGRAILIGSNTGGAGHYGGARVFGGGRFEMFLPVGNSYAPGAESWEGVGVAPHIRVEPDQALAAALREIGAPVSLAEAVPPLAGPMRVDAAPPTRRYGIAMTPLQGGESFITVAEVIAGNAAAETGLRAGDRIVAVNGRAVADITPADFDAAMRASPLTLEIERGGARLIIAMSLES